MSVRRVLVGLAHPRASWPAQLSRWSTSGAEPIEFLTCLSANEVRAVLGSGRQPSAVLLDGSSAQVDRDLVADVEVSGVLPVGVDSADSRADWDALGCAVVLPHGFDAAALADVLARHCRAADQLRAVQQRVAMSDPTRGGTLIAVSGSAGAGSSTVAMAAAQGLTPRTESSQRVVLVDGVRRGDLAMYHDTGDVLPGLPELIERVRRASEDPAELRALVFPIGGRDYDLLLGEHRATGWSTHRRRSVWAALDVVARAYESVVVDHDGDLEDESTTGSTDIGDRNAVSLALAQRADVWVHVVGPGTKGLHDAVRAVDEAVDAGVPHERILIVINGMSRSTGARTASAIAFRRLTAGRGGAGRAPVFVPRIRRLAGVHHDAAVLPAALVRPVGSAVQQVLLAAGPREVATGAATATVRTSTTVRAAVRPLVAPRREVPGQSPAAGTPAEAH